MTILEKEEGERERERVQCFASRAQAHRKSFETSFRLRIILKQPVGGLAALAQLSTSSRHDD